MSKVRTLSSINNRSSQEDWKSTPGNKLQRDSLSDEPDCGTATGNISRRISININTAIPQKLNNNDVCSLYGKFLQDLEEEDREMYIEKLRQEKITGRTLVQACENVKVMEELKQTLGFPFDVKLRFEDMIKMIKKRENELKEENNECEQGCDTFPTESTNTPMEHGQTISNAGCVFGVIKESYCKSEKNQTSNDSECGYDHSGTCLAPAINFR